MEYDLGVLAVFACYAALIVALAVLHRLGYR